MTSNPNKVFRVALLAEFFDGDGKLVFKDIGLDVFDDHAHIETFIVDENRPVLGADQIREAQAVIVGGTRVSAESVSEAEKWKRLQVGQ